MRLTLSIIAIVISGNLFAQTNKVTNEDKSLGIKEKYYVLKSDKKIKEGVYTAYTILGDQLVCEGSYKNNLKDSIWNYYNYQHKLVEFGRYENGEKVGVWNVFDSKAGLEIQYDFTNKKLLVYNLPKPDRVSKLYCVINGNDTVKTFLGRPPIFLESAGKYLIGLRYPLAAKEHNIQGSVLIGFMIDSNGKVSNFRVKKSLGYGCDEEALKVVRNGFNGDWLPGLLNRSPVAVEYEVPISFSLR